MKLLNKLSHPLIIWLLIVPLCWINNLLPNNHVLWVSFQCWALYFLVGATLQGGLKAALNYFCGLIAAVAIFEVAGLTGAALGPWTLSFAVGLIAALIVLIAESVKSLDMVPAWFIGAGTFFGYAASTAGASTGYVLSIFNIFISLIFGFVNGWLTIWLYGKYAAWAKNK